MNYVLLEFRYSTLDGTIFNSPYVNLFKSYKTSLRALTHYFVLWNTTMASRERPLYISMADKNFRRMVSTCRSTLESSFRRFRRSSNRLTHIDNRCSLSCSTLHRSPMAAIFGVHVSFLYISAYRYLRLTWIKHTHIMSMLFRLEKT